MESLVSAVCRYNLGMSFQLQQKGPHYKNLFFKNSKNIHSRDSDD